MKSERELRDLLRCCPRLGSRWRHYRGALYLVRELAILEATGEAMVVYTRHGSGEAINWARPLREWLELVQHEGKPTPRFAPAEGEEES